MVKKVILLFLLVMLLMSCISSVQATPTHTDLCELTELDNLGFERMSEVYTLQARSAFRVGNIGTGGDSWEPISSPYNAPRPHPSAGGAHNGLDLAANRPVFAVAPNGEVQRAWNDFQAGYGREVVVNHWHSENGKTYWFKTQYAHLTSVALNQGATVGTASRVGHSGGSGSAEGSYPVHLHLEFRQPSNVAYRTRPYSPQRFYRHVTEYANGEDTAYITIRSFPGPPDPVPNNNLVVRIRGLRSLEPQLPAPGDVKLWYKTTSNTWASADMSSLGQGVFSINMINLPSSTYPTKTFYISSITSDWGSPNTAYRPYRYRNPANPPRDTPFVINMQNGTLAAASIHDLQALVADYVPLGEVGEKLYASYANDRKPFDYDATAIIVKQLGKEHWLVEDSVTGKLLVVYCDTPHALADMNRGRPFLFGGYLVKESYEGYPTYQISPYTATPLDVPN